MAEVFYIPYSRETGEAQSPFGSSSQDESTSPMSVREGTIDDLREVWDSGTMALQQQFESFDQYVAYMREASDMLKQQAWWDAKAVDVRTSTQQLREGEDLGTGMMQAQPDDLRQSDYNARMSQYNQWLNSDENQALMQKYGIQDTYYNQDGDQFRWTGAGYVKTVKQDDHASFGDYMKALVKAAPMMAIGAGVGNMLLGVAQSYGMPAQFLNWFANTMETSGTLSTIADVYNQAQANDFNLFAPPPPSGPTGSGTSPLNSPTGFAGMAGNLGVGALFDNLFNANSLEEFLNSWKVFVPSIPTGLPLPPSFMVLGTLYEVLTNPAVAGTAVWDKIKGSWEQIKGALLPDADGNWNPSDVLSKIGGIITDTYKDADVKDIPEPILAGILAGTYGQGVIDWFKKTFESDSTTTEQPAEETLLPPIGGDQEEQKADAVNLGQTDTRIGELDPDLVGNVEDIFKGDTLDETNDYSNFSDRSPEDTFQFTTEGTTDDPLAGVEEPLTQDPLTQIEDVFTGSGGSGGGIGSGTNTGFDKFYSGITYAPTLPAPLQVTAPKDFVTPLLTPKKYQGSVKSLFQDYLA